MDKESRHTEPAVTRRDLLRVGVAGVLGGAAATALTASPASAADGDPIILGQDNLAFSPTTIHTDGFKRELDIFPGSSGQILNAASVNSGPVIFAKSFGGGSGISGISHEFGVDGFGDVAGIRGHSVSGIGVHGFSEGGTAVKAETPEPDLALGLAFEAAGRVKFSTSGLADVAASTDRVTVDPGVPVTSQSKVLATLQGNPGTKSMVEHVELDPEADTFKVVLTKPAIRPVQIAWFLIS